MIQVNLKSLMEFLQKEGYSASIQEETQQVYAPLKIEGHEFPLFLRIFHESELLQIIIFIPTQIKEGTHNDLARLMHLINKELDIPGFGMDEGAGVPFYRVMLPAFGRKIDPEVLRSYLKSLDLICKNFAPAVITVANGASTYDEILQKVQEAK